MIDLYTGPTANGHRAAIAVAESGLEHRVHKLNLMAGDQRKPEFLAINPAGVIPAIVDSDGPGGRPLVLAQSGAIVLYLAEKTGKWMPADPARRAAALQWFMQACSDCAGTSGAIFQLSVVSPEKVPANIELFEKRLLKFFGDADKRLEGRDFLADEFSIADIALYPIVATRKALVDKAGGYANLNRWVAAVAARPGVAKGMTLSV